LPIRPFPQYASVLLSPERSRPGGWWWARSSRPRLPSCRPMWGGRSHHAFYQKGIAHNELPDKQAQKARQQGVQAHGAALPPLSDVLSFSLSLHRSRGGPEHGACALRYGRPLSVIMGDIDHFKAINDTHGHHAGDLVLISISRAIIDAMRDRIDWVCRYGGKEFIVVLPETRI